MFGTVLITIGMIFFAGEHKMFLKCSQKNNAFIILLMTVIFLTQFMKGRLINIRVKTCPSQYRNTLRLKY